MKRNDLFLAAFAVLLAGCSSNEETQTEVSDALLSVSTSLESSVASTRSVVDGTYFPTSSVIGVFVTGTGYTSTNTQYTGGGSSTTAWSLVSGYSDIYLTANTATVYGFYPSTATPTMTTTPTLAVTVPVSLDMSTYDATDYMYATPASATRTSTSVALAFKHALAEVTFKVIKGTTFGGSGSLTALTLTKTSGFYGGTTAGSMLLTTGVLTLATAGTISLTSVGKTIDTDGESTTILAAPITSTSGITLALTIDGASYSGTLPTTAASWVAGNHYTYTITVGGGTLTISGVSITDWAAITGGSVSL